jgi:ubiquinone/menaquinone biosynthesis C-methylase UbiE
MSQGKTHLTTRQNYDRLSRWYDSFSAGEQRLTKTGLDLLDVQPGEKILEIGFGTGHALIHLGRAVGETGRVSGIDLSPGMHAISRWRVKKSKMETRISVQLGDAIQLPFHDYQFQAVFMSFTLELFETSEIPVVLAECRRVLMPEGRLGIVSLAKNDSRAVHIYEWFHFRLPEVIDCRPIFVRPTLEYSGFEITRAVTGRMWGLPVEAVLARKS